MATLVPSVQSRPGYFDAASVTVLQEIPFERDGIFHLLSFYYVQNPFALGAALLEKTGSRRVMWRTANPIWYSAESIQPLAIRKKRNRILFTFQTPTGKQSRVFFLDALFGLQQTTKMVLTRATQNPILDANPHHAWESSAVFNAGAVYLDHKVHFIYRAIMSNGESVLGYAYSLDGISINYRTQLPIYFNMHASSQPVTCAYQSGSSGVGYEDPRLSHSTIPFT